MTGASQHISNAADYVGSAELGMLLTDARTIARGNPLAFPAPPPPAAQTDSTMSGKRATRSTPKGTPRQGYASSGRRKPSTALRGAT
jgi:hypothetical protein